MVNYAPQFTECEIFPCYDISSELLFWTWWVVNMLHISMDSQM